MSEKTNAFTRKLTPIMLSTGEMLTVDAPKLRWYADFFFPRLQEALKIELNPEVQADLVTGMKTGKLESAVIQKLPRAWIDLIMDVIAYQFLDTGQRASWPQTLPKKREWCRDNLDLADGLHVLLELAKLIDLPLVMGFFGDLVQQLKEAEMLIGKKASGSAPS